jgi:hypothetical protein
MQSELEARLVVGLDGRLELVHAVFGRPRGDRIDERRADALSPVLRHDGEERSAEIRERRVDAYSSGSGVDAVARAEELLGCDRRGFPRRDVLARRGTARHDLVVDLERSLELGG